jgi:hypothetical protein
LHTWHHLSWFLFEFYSCEVLELVVFSITSSSSSKTEFVWSTSCIFWCLEVLPVCLRREVKPFIIWFYPPWLDHDVSLHKVVEIVVVIPMSPRSSKTESRCSSYCRFCFGVSASFTGAALAGPGPETKTIASLFQSGFLSRNSRSGQL